MTSGLLFPALYFTPSPGQAQSVDDRCIKVTFTLINTLIQLNTFKRLSLVKTCGTYYLSIITLRSIRFPSYYIHPAALVNFQVMFVKRMHLRALLI